MTAPTRRFSVLGLAAALVVGAVLLLTARSVPVPAVGMPAFRLDQVFVSAPARLPSPMEASVPLDAESVEGPVTSVSLESSGGASTHSHPLPQARPQALPEPRLIIDQNRRFVLRADLERGEPQRGVGAAVLGDGVRLIMPPGSETMLFLSDDRLWFFDLTTIVDNTIHPIRAPFPGGPPRELTEIPRILNAEEIIAEIAAAYPQSLRDRGLGGTVGVQFLVGEAGEVRNIRISAIAAYDELTAAAGRVAEVYRFSPARAGDAYVAVWVSHAIDFRVP